MTVSEPLAAGAAGFLAQAFDINELLAIIERHLT